jgi:hypothetical protein
MHTPVERTVPTGPVPGPAYWWAEGSRGAAAAGVGATVADESGAVLGAGNEWWWSVAGIGSVMGPPM